MADRVRDAGRHAVAAISREGAFEEGRYRVATNFGTRCVPFGPSAAGRATFRRHSGTGALPGSTDHERVTVVDHTEILPSDALPTFNSHAIESALHRIDGLAEQFVYFNDDVLLGRSLRPELFFTSSGLPRVLERCPGPSAYVDDADPRRGHAPAAGPGTARGTVRPCHCFGSRTTPHIPLLRSMMQRHRVEFSGHRRAHRGQPIPILIRSQHRVIVRAGTTRWPPVGRVVSDIANDYVHVESGRLQWHLDRIRLRAAIPTRSASTRPGSVRCGCANSAIREFFEEYFPVAAPWEVDRPNEEPGPS